MSERISTNLVWLDLILNSDEDILRRKVIRLIKTFNNGSTEISRYGIHVDVVAEFEKMLNKATKNDISEALRILRE